PSREGVRRALAEADLTADDRTIDEAHYHAMHAFDTAGDGEDARIRAYRETYASAVTGSSVTSEAAAVVLGKAFETRGHWTQPTSDGRSTLAALSERGLPTVIVSNTTYGDAAEQLAAAAVCQVGPGEGATVTEIVDSTVAGIHKPDPQIV